eukprot:scaffold95501_cov54-Phaeocystis_antarctica.AAC.1
MHLGRAGQLCTGGRRHGRQLRLRMHAAGAMQWALPASAAAGLRGGRAAAQAQQQRVTPAPAALRATRPPAGPAGAARAPQRSQAHLQLAARQGRRNEAYSEPERLPRRPAAAVTLTPTNAISLTPP